MTYEQLQQQVATQVAEARAGYRADVDRVLGRLRELADKLEPCIGDCSPAEVFEAWCRAGGRAVHGGGR